MTGPRRYIQQPVEIEAMFVTESNCREAATWCGGGVVFTSATNIGNLGGVTVPHLDGSFEVYVGEYLARDLDTGRFFRLSASDFKDFKYVEKPLPIHPRESWEGFKPLGVPVNRDWQVTGLATDFPSQDPTKRDGFTYTP